MKKIEKILFPVDLSESSDKIVSCVVEFAERFEAEVHLLFVARVFGYFSTIYVNSAMISSMEEAICEGARKSLLEFKTRYFITLPNVLSKVVPGYPSEEIIRYSEEEGMDLIIMGTHGRSGLGKVVFGSVADQVVKTSKIPVTVVNPFRKSNLS
ncbi:universal stress protein [bacterium]|nr:universal stress protein [bacterium]